MNAGRGWTIALTLGLISMPARAQLDAAADATDAAPPGSDSGTPDSCNLSTKYDGDEQCILPPASGFQLHYGPASYDDNAAAPYLRRPGDETIQCFYLKTPNTQYVSTNEFQFRSRPGLFEATLYRLPAARPDSAVPEVCGGLNDAIPVLSARHLAPDVTLRGAPENEGLAWELAPATQLALRVHTVNITAHDLLEESWINVIASDSATVVSKLGGLSLRGLRDAIPPGDSVAHSFGCAAPGDLRVVQIVAVASGAVQEVKVQVRRADGSREPIYDSFDWNEPIILRYDSVTSNPAPNAATRQSGGYSGVLNLHPGDSLEWECQLVNQTDHTIPYGPDLIYDQVQCDVRGILVRSDGTSWTCEDDRRTPDAGTGAAGSPGTGGRPALPDAGRAGSGGAGGMGRAGARATGGTIIAPAPDGGGDVAASGVTSESGCNCRLSSGTERDPWNLATALLALVCLSTRRGLITARRRQSPARKARSRPSRQQNLLR
jgi:hypothetical protein